MRRLALVVVCTIIAFTVGAVAPASAASASAVARVSYRPPVDGPIVDDWRPPPQNWNAGNRGIDYAPPPGTPVKAAAEGEVTFAGQVGGELHVVVLHPDGIRTTYAFLASIAVHRGDKVRQGDVVGTTGDKWLHFGARILEQYIDPRLLFDKDGPPQVFLVPDELRRPGTEAEERRGLSRYLKDIYETGRRAVGVVVDYAKDEITSFAGEVAGAVHYAVEFDPIAHVWRVVRTGYEWYQQRDDCTSADVSPPKVPEPRVAVLVGGLGSTSEHDSIDEVDPDDLGYVDHVRFSYNGGTTDQNPYGKGDTTTDLREEAERLRLLLAEVERQHPGVPIDIIAHSQGGIIAREALAHGYDSDDRKVPGVKNIVTLATPHRGTDVATGLTMLSHTDVGDLALSGISAFDLTDIDPTGASIGQLSEVSTFLWDLNHTPLPQGIQLTSIGSRTDTLVPALHTRAPGGRNIIVDVPGIITDHSHLPGSAEGRREVALAVAGMPPTCQTLTNMLADTVVADGISTFEDAVAAAAYVGAKRLDTSLEGKGPTRNDPDPPPRPPSPPSPPSPARP